MSQAELDTLIGLVNSNRYTEVKCGRYLKYIVKRMVRNEGQLFEPIRNSTELALHRGRADFIISATNHQSGGVSHDIYIWELKASKCHIFQYDNDNDNRLRPSNSLYDAEHKLINYFYDLQGDQDARREFSPPGGAVIEPNNVHMGGIIIGKNSNRIKELIGGDINEINRQYLTATTTRNILYQGKIMILTWDDVIEAFKQVNIAGQHVQGLGVLEVNVSPDIQYLKINR